jgi:hypothetical protein
MKRLRQRDELSQAGSFGCLTMAPELQTLASHIVHPLQIHVIFKPKIHTYMKELQAFQPLRVPRKGDAVLTSQL